MTIFLHGKDDYRRTLRLQEAIRQFLAKFPGSGIRRFDAELDEDVPGAVAEILSGTSLFSPRVFVIVTSALELKPGELKPLIERTAASETQHLLLVADADKPTKPYARLTEDDVKEEAYPELVGEEWAAFVAREAKARGLKLARTDLRRLESVFLRNAWGLATELDVLAAMPEELRPERLAETARFAPQGMPDWGMLRSLGLGEPAKRLGILARLEATGDPAAKIFAMAAYTASPKAAAAGDVNVKTGGWDYEEALVSLAIS